MDSKDCIHYEACSYHCGGCGWKNIKQIEEDHCPHFKNKADVEPIKHAEWRICCDGWYPYCSNCGYEPPWVSHTDMRTPRCPYCGAKMRNEWEG